MQISALKLKHGRVQVFVDEKYVFSCTQNFVVKHMLYVDKQYSVEKLAEVVVDAQRSIVEYKLAEYATGGLYSKKELAQKVNKYSQKRFEFIFNEHEMLDALNRLENSRLYDEIFIIKALINTYTARKKSKMYIKNKLLAKGFSKQSIESFLEETKPEEFRENLRSILEKKLPTLTSKTQNTFELRQKLTQFASGKGFQYKDIKDILDQILR